MAWLIGDSFDFYSTTTDMLLPGGIWASASTVPTLSASTRFSTGQSIVISNTSVNFASVTFANSTTIWVNFVLDWTGAITGGGTSQGIGFSLKDGASNQVGIYIRNGGDIVVTNGAIAGTVLATSSALIAQNIYNHLQFKIVISNTTGSVELRMNGSTTAAWNPTGLNTRNGTVNAQCNSIQFNGAVGVNAGSIDDFYCFNDQTAAPQDWQGDIRAVQQMPSSDSSVTWSHSTGTTNFPQVNELKQNSDTTYVFTSTVNNVDAYGVPALATTPTSIVAVQTKMIARMDDVGPHTVKSRLTSGGTNADSANLSLSTSYQWISQVNTVDPHTSAAWTPTNLAAVTIGPFDVL
jgi:hypothetical protein